MNWPSDSHTPAYLGHANARFRELDDNLRRCAPDEDHRSVAGGLFVDGRGQLRTDERNQLFEPFVVAHGSIMMGRTQDTKSGMVLTVEWCRYRMPAGHQPNASAWACILWMAGRGRARRGNTGASVADADQAAHTGGGKPLTGL